MHVGHDQGGGLHESLAFVAAGGLASFERRDQAIGQRHGCIVGLFESIGHGIDDRRTNEQVPLHGVVSALSRAGVEAVFPAGEGGRASLHVDDAQLPQLAIGVVFQ